MRVLFERKDSLINDEILYEAKVFYDGFIDTNNLVFRIYNECSSTYGEGIFMNWSEGDNSAYSMSL